MHLLSISFLSPHHPIPTASQNRASATEPSVLEHPHNNAFQLSSAPVSRAYNPAHCPALWGPCAPHPTTHPIFKKLPVHPCPIALLPGLRWEHSPYTCIPLPDVSPRDSAPSVPPRRNSSSRSEPAQPRLKPIELPPQITGVTAVTLNPVLRAGANGNVGIGLDFALAVPCMGLDVAGAGVLAELATFPALPSLTLLSRRLPWAITVHAAGASVVVLDVLQAIQLALSISITEEEFMEHQGQEESRLQGPRSLKRTRQYRIGMTRLELLKSATVFGGLSESPMGCEVWMVDFV
ncbi:hypothetical protein C8R47DRAFT_1024762 [Mycena vitilis]|nr:hypothetical protein C8R47DRAFT_1024762 [Mycena vitilis]